ncbi:hypothetical protein ACXWPL_09350, partial [Streptococcus pyogenes]
MLTVAEKCRSTADISFDNITLVAFGDTDKELEGQLFFPGSERAMDFKMSLSQLDLPRIGEKSYRVTHF